MVTEKIVLEDLPSTEGVKMRGGEGQIEAGWVRRVASVDEGWGAVIEDEKVIVSEEGEKKVAKVAREVTAPRNVVAVKISREKNGAK